MKTIDVIVTILVLVGALNYGFVGFFDFNVLAYVFGHMPLLERVIYMLIGLGALYQVLVYLKVIKCEGKG